jgi:hypothetical protein
MALAVAVNIVLAASTDPAIAMTATTSSEIRRFMPMFPRPSDMAKRVFDPFLSIFPKLQKVLCSEISRVRLFKLCWVNIWVGVEDQVEDEVSRFFTRLGHPLRRKIIQYLGDNEHGGFTDLKAHLDVSTGTLYYQLDLLSDLIEQDDERKYHLNEKGGFAYKLLLESEERFASSRYVKRNPTILGYVTLSIIGWRFISYLYGMPKLAVATVASILLYGAWITNLSGLYPVVFIYLDHLPLAVYYIPVLFIAGYLLVNLLANLTSYLVYRSTEGVRNLFLGSAVAILPSIIMPTAYVTSRYLQAPLTGFQAQALMVIGIGYSLCILTSAISLSKGLAAAKAALPASVSLYASLVLAFILTTL